MLWRARVAAHWSCADLMVPVNSGPLAGGNIYRNGNCGADSNLQPGRSTGNNTFITISKEIHTLNDAILAAAKELSTRLKERRRIIYVVTDSDIYAEGGVNSIEKGCAKIAEEARTQYTLGYLSHESIYDGKYRSIDVRFDRPVMVVTAKPGYYPSAQDYK